MHARHLLAALVLALAAPLALAETYVVDAKGHGDFVDLQDAIDAAVAGDVLLVRGTQVGHAIWKGPPSFTVTKSLTIRGIGASPKIVGSGDQDADFTGLVIDAGPTSDVALIDLRIEGGYGRSFGMNGPDGVRVVSAGSLFVGNCTVLAGSVYLSIGDSHPDLQEGIDARGAESVVLRDCTIRGGDGAYNEGYQGMDALTSDGGAAVILGGSRALLDHCDLTGGDGGDCVIRIPWSSRKWGYGAPSSGGADGGAGLDFGTCAKVVLLGGSQVGGRHDEYLVDWSDRDTWLGWLFFRAGQDGPAVLGDQKRGK